MPDAVVLGAGVIGLTSAVLLAESGLAVECWTADPPAETTSRVAGALWAAPPLEDPDGSSGALGRRLAGGRSASSPASPPVACASPTARWPRGNTPARRGRCSPACSCVTRRTAGRLPGGIRARRAADRDGALPGVPAAAPVQRRRRDSWHAVWARWPSPPGTHRWSSTAAASEPASWRVTTRSEPVRGQHVVVENPGLEEFFMEDRGAPRVGLLVSPRRAGRAGRRRPAGRGGSPARTRRSRAGILERCAALEPRLAHARVLGEMVGLAPVPAVGPRSRPRICTVPAAYTTTATVAAA